MRLLSTTLLSLALLVTGCTGHRARDARTAAAVITAFAFVVTVAADDGARSAGECSDGERRVEYVDEYSYVETDCRCSVSRR